MRTHIRDKRAPLGIALTSLTPTQLARLRALERYDISFVAKRLAREKGMSAVSAESAVLEFKRYIGLAVLGYRGLAVPSQEVDEVWHAFLLFTREYEAFCRNAVGFFVHHVPSASDRKLSGSARLAEAYGRVFGFAPSKGGHCATCTSCRASLSAGTCH
jgi:hypothetical protein